MIRGVAKAIIPVEDQDRAKDFWNVALGFEVSQDEPYGHERWLEVRTPDNAVTLVLQLTDQRDTPNSASADLPTSNVMFYCDDLKDTYQELVGRGVHFPQPPVEQPFGWWSMFEDREGNRFALTPPDNEARDER